MDIKAISKNIQRLTEKEKQTFIESLLGNSATLTFFLAEIQKKIKIPMPPDIHYIMLMTMCNLNSLTQNVACPDVMDYSLKEDGYEDKLISILKQLNEIYKDKLECFH